MDLHSKFSAWLVTASILMAGAAALMPTSTPGPEPTAAPGGPQPTGWDSPVASPQTGVRPLLVVLMEFTDVAHNSVLTPAFLRNQVFGPRPSVNDYYLETSYGQFSFSDQGSWAWITAYDDPGTGGADESTRAYWNTAPDPTYNGGTFQRWGLKSLDVAGFNFAPLDFSSDGTIDFGQEVAYLLIDANTVGAFGGAMRGMPPGLVLDGKTIAGVSCGVSAGTPWITLYAHELAHQTSWGPGWFLTDYYGIIPEIIGQFSLMGFSGFGSSPNVSPNGPHHLDPLSKIKLGWATPSGVTTDGFYSIDNSEGKGTFYVLWDPAHGKDEYFVVENRWRGTSYDNTDALIGALPAPFAYQGAAAEIPDEGLLVWHVDELRDWNGSTTGGKAKVDLIRRGGTDGTAAFNSADFSYYDWWDGSAPENAKFNDASNSNLGVWCVSPAAATMTAWLDGPGPGILICSPPSPVSAVPGTPVTMSVPFRNTGSSTDTFTVSVSAPSDILVTLPSPLSVGAKATGTANIGLTPIRACTTTPGPRTITITISGGSVSSVTTGTLNVLSYGDPIATLAASDNDVYPGETGTYTVSVTNNGNAADTFGLAFTGLDFGTTYRAYPTAIPGSWASFAPAGPTAGPCAMTSSTLSIAVPPDWAGMEDATYDFTVTATSATTPSASSLTAGQLIVRATPLSMMYYVKYECLNLQSAVGALPPSDVRDGLMDKAIAACAKFDQAMARYVLGDDPPASNLFGTVQNVLGAFLHQIAAQRGKALTDAQADDLQMRAEQIIADIDAILAAI